MKYDVRSSRVTSRARTFQRLVRPLSDTLSACVSALHYTVTLSRDSMTVQCFWVNRACYLSATEAFYTWFIANDAVQSKLRGWAVLAPINNAASSDLHLLLTNLDCRMYGCMYLLYTHFTASRLPEALYSNRPYMELSIVI